MTQGIWAIVFVLLMMHLGKEISGLSHYSVEIKICLVLYVMFALAVITLGVSAVIGAVA